MKIYSHAIRIALIIFISSCVFLFSSSSYAFKRRPSSATYFELGATYLRHYNNVDAIRTPPSALLGSIVVGYQTPSALGFYAHYDRSLSSPTIETRGIGMNIEFLNFCGARSRISCLAFSLLTDVIYYTYPTPVLPKVNDTSGISYRFGGGLRWVFKGENVFMNTSVVGGVISDNFMVAPSISFGIVL